MLIKSNRTALQTYKVEERTFGTPCNLHAIMWLKLWERVGRHSATCNLLCRTIIRRAICEGGAIWEGNQALGRMNSDIIGFHKGGTSKDLYIQVFHDQSVKLEHMLSVSKGKLGFTNDLPLVGMIRQPYGRTGHSYQSQLSASEQWTSESCYQWPQCRW